MYCLQRKYLIIFSTQIVIASINQQLIWYLLNNFHTIPHDIFVMILCMLKDMSKVSAWRIYLWWIFIRKDSKIVQISLTHATQQNKTLRYLFRIIPTPTLSNISFLHHAHKLHRMISKRYHSWFSTRNVDWFRWQFEFITLNQCSEY